MDYERLIQLTVSYFKYKNYNDFQTYSNQFNWWKRVIGYVCGVTDRAVIRSLFDRLVKRGFLKKGKRGKSTFYMFDAHDEYEQFVPKRPSLKVTFD